MLKNRWFLEGQIEPSIWLYALSFLYAKKVSSEVFLHTDTIGEKHLSCIPYDKIYLSLDELEDEHEKFWAFGKIKALENEPLGSIHIDGDVFFKSKAVIPYLNFKDFDVICQMVEGGNLFSEGYENQLPYFDNALKSTHIPGYGNVRKAFNCGVLGFNNLELKNQFLYNFKTMVKYAKLDKAIMFKMDGKYEPNIILEQYQLAGLCELNNYKIKFILDPVEVDKRNSLNMVAEELGFVHAWGKAKYTVAFQNKVKEKIKQIDNNLYKIIERHTKKLNRQMTLS